MALSKKEKILYAVVAGATIGLVKATAEIIYSKWFAKKVEGNITPETLDIWDNFATEQAKRTEGRIKESLDDFDRKEEELVKSFKEYCEEMRYDEEA